MKNDEDILDLENKKEGSSVPDDDDVIELVNVVEVESASEVSTLEDEIGKSISALEEPLSEYQGDEKRSALDDAPEPVDEIVLEFESETVEEYTGEVMDVEEKLVFEEATPLDDAMRELPEAEEQIELEDLDEELRFDFSKAEGIGEDTEAFDIVKDDAEDTEDALLYDEDGKVIGEMLAGDEPDDFERELDTMLESLDLTDDSDDLELLEADLGAASDMGPFKESAYDTLGAEGPDAGFQALGGLATPMAAGLGASALSGLPGESDEIAGQAAPAGISEAQLEAIIERVAEKVAERVARETIPQVAERVITQAINALKESLER
ncbi:MAG: hypothetical protein JRK53_12680 [Deltaproteobacteria bacterium]|nr:hypothetical protein [Deltaproteobacteria bacterium]